MKDKPTRTDLSKGEFSPSGLVTATCLRRFYYEKVLGMKPISTPVALVFGIAVHKAVEKFYQLTSGKDKISHEEKVAIKIAVIQAFTASWTEGGLAGDMKRNLETGIMICNAYVERYVHEGSRFSLEDIETEQFIPMPNGTVMLVKLDRVLREKHMVVLVDTKTTSGAITPYFFRQFENHLPTSLYTYVLRQLLGRCDYVMIDAIKVPPPSATSASEPFGRQTFMRTDLQIEDAVNTYVNKTDYIMNALAKPEEQWASRFYCNMNECDKYSGCPFLDVCKHGMTHPTVRINFDIKTPKWREQ